MTRRISPRCSALLWLAVTWAFVSHGLASEKGGTEATQSPLSPAESLKHFQIAPGTHIELVASEPQVVDPVAIRFDEQGRMWVVEMRDYPHGPGEGESPTSRIVVLEDKNNDGHFEHATLFADSLLFATGIQPWRQGVFVTMAGQVAYLKDTDGDGRCDEREAWYTGFAEQNSQLRANHPRLGLDNQIYVANGLRGGAVVDARTPRAKPLSISGMDFRFDPLTRKFAAVSGVGQFGMTFDDRGNRFVCSNRNPLKHIVLENDELKKNPLARITSLFHDVAKAGAESRVYPISRAWTTSNLHAGQFTAACGVTIYRGHALPASFYGNSFTCDPTGNLVHREILRGAGPTFDASPAREGIEFLASPDEWFRPVNLEVGPDGALYLIDMYRAVIEHPQFMPSELKNRRDLLLGKDRGRIYRIRSTSETEHRAVRNLAAASSKELLRSLGARNCWTRETAARLLLERQDKSIRQGLETVTQETRSPLASAHALWLLNSMETLSPPHLQAAMGHRDAHVRRQAAKLAQNWPEQDELRRSVRGLAKDADPAVRFQAALSLAPARTEVDAEALWQILRQDAADDWTRRAVLIASGTEAANLVMRLLSRPQTRTMRDNDVVLCLTELVPIAAENAAVSGRSQAADLLDRLLTASATSARQRLSALLAFERAMNKRRIEISSLVRDTKDDEFIQRFEDSLKSTLAIARDDASIDAWRSDAIELLGHLGKKVELTLLTGRSASQATRIRAIRALAATTEVTAWNDLLAGFPGESPEIRREVIAGVLRNKMRTIQLLNEIDGGRIAAGEIDRSSVARLLKHRDQTVRDRAAKMFQVAADRKKALADYQAVLAMKSSPQRGREVFQRNCANCHRVGELGVNVAPDISDSRTKQPAQILADILQPNRAIDNNYIAYNVATKEGEVLNGILASETSTSITLRQPEGKTRTLLRDEIDVIRSTGISLMPEGLEKNIPRQAMADLISFIKNWRYLDGRTPLPAEQ